MKVRACFAKHSVPYSPLLISMVFNDCHERPGGIGLKQESTRLGNTSNVFFPPSYCCLGTGKREEALVGEGIPRELTFLNLNQITLTPCFKLSNGFSWTWNKIHSPYNDCYSPFIIWLLQTSWNPSSFIIPLAYSALAVLSFFLFLKWAQTHSHLRTFALDDHSGRLFSKNFSWLTPYYLI